MRTLAATLALTLALGCDDPSPAPRPDAAADALADRPIEAPAGPAEAASEAAPADTAAPEVAPTEVTAETAPDVAPEVAAEAGDAIASADATDAAADGPRPSSFPERLTDAVWLVGWAGGNEHWSWVRFHLDAGGTSGRWETAPLRCVAKSCVGYFKRPAMFVGCVSTTGTFVVERPNRLRIAVPADCRGSTTDAEIWAFGAFRTPGDRVRSLESVGITLAPAVNHIGAHRYPADFCGADLATCAVVPFATSI